ncbi:GATA-type domain-containing protein [Heracleum sosnowskyi]|uniref:GATA-type domain-containing protein n=1 Tax=Heracleum sosnowskyi TaxID=360622 RepID=A0AAD8HVC8_9APIA|nr:GATA-type domain-containing protein [Heracleum sosnowskyi]
MKFSPGFPSMSGAGGYWDRFINGDDSFHNIINVLDFPLESVEEDKGAAENWEPQFQSLELLNSEIFQGLAPVLNSVNAEDTHNNLVQNDADRKQLPVTEISSTHVPLDSFNPTNPSLFQTPSPNYVMESSSSCSAGKNLPTCPELPVPVKTRTKIPRRSTISRWHLISPLFKKTSNSKSKKKIKKLSQLPNEYKLSEGCYHQHMPSKKCMQCQAVKTPQWRDGPMGPKTLCNACGVRYRSGRLLRKTHPIESQDPGRNGRMNTRNIEKKIKELPGLSNDSEPVGVASHQHGQAKRCAHCQVVNTPQWRDGPMGPRTLCNACGVRYRMGRLLPEYRPAASPTFVPSLHSNRHSEVIKMREKPIPDIIKPEMDPAMSQPPETVPMSNNIYNYM